jgi:tetratricopeptide (TPR) repeat protein
VLILDCCFSGAFARGFNAKSGGLDPVAGRLGGGYIVLTASSDLDYAFDGGGDESLAPPPSAFTAALIEGISSGAADYDADGWITARDLHRFAGSVVSLVSRQQPQYFSAQESGEVLLCRAGGSGQARDYALRAPYVRREEYHRQLLDLVRRGAKKVAIVGEPGNGKTHLARAVAEELCTDHDAVTWLNAYSPSTLFRDLIGELARRGERTQLDAEAARRELISLLASPNPAHVIVLDNVEDWQAVADLIPSHVSTTILITSRREPRGIDGLATIRMRPMNSAESVGLVQRLLPGASAAEAKRLARELGGWPLAIAQACGLISTGTGVGIAELLAAVAQEPARVFDGDHDGALTAIYRRTLGDLTLEHPTSGRLLRMIALLAPTAIPVAVLRAALAEDDPSAPTGPYQAIWFSNVVTELSRRSLVEIEEGLLTIHPLSQAVLRGICERDSSVFSARLVLVLCRELQLNQADGMLKLDGLAVVPHAVEALRGYMAGCHTDHPLAQIDGASSALGVLVRGLIQVGDCRQAVALLQELGVLDGECRAHTLTEEFLPAIVESGEALRFLDRNALSIENYRKVLSYAGLPRALRIRALAGLGGALKMFQRYSDAGIAFEEALDLLMTDPDPDPLLLGQCQFGLGNVRFGTSRWEEAAEFYSAGLASFDLVPGSPAAVRGRIDCLKGLADIAIKLNRLEDARDFVRRATQVRDEARWFRDLHTDSKLAQARGDVVRMALVPAALSGGLDRAGVEECIAAYQEAHDLYRKIGARLGQALSLYRIACVYGLHDTAAARAALLEARAVFSATENLLGMQKCMLLAAKLDLIDGLIAETDAEALLLLASSFRDECHSRYWYGDAVLTAYVTAKLRSAQTSDQDDAHIDELLTLGQETMHGLRRDDKSERASAVARGALAPIALLAE